MTHTIERLIKVCNYPTPLLSDNWTVVTKKSLLSTQRGQTLLVTDNSLEILTPRNEER